MPLPDGVRCVLTDIEGTTTPISFVYEVLFPFAESRLEAWFEGAREGTPTADAVAQLSREYRKDAGRVGLPAFGNGAPYARYLMAQDRKSTALKTIQGIIWREGYESGELRGEVFADVPEALSTWRQSGIRLRVFSSGSVLAQELLFGNTEYGDLTSYFEGFHDTTTGPKKEAASYARIAAAAKLRPPQILFLSDVPAELDAAADAGMATGLLQRHGNAPAALKRHPAYSSFSELI